MDARAAARAFALGRCAVGTAYLVAPRWSARAWIGGSGGRPGVDVLSRALGIRDVLLGALTLHVVGNPQAGPRWVATCAVADAVDFVATAAARDDIPAGKAAAVMAIAGGSAIAGFGLAGALRAPSVDPG